MSYVKLDCCFQSQNFIESLCILYLLYHWFLGKQTSCVCTITNHQSKYNHVGIYTDSNTLTYSIARHTTGEGGGYFAAQGDKPCYQCWWFVFQHFSSSDNFLVIVNVVSCFSAFSTMEYVWSLSISFHVLLYFMLLLTSHYQTHLLCLGCLLTFTWFFFFFFFGCFLLFCFFQFFVLFTL